ncbi:MAG: 5-formyltetrahydrofolate cyclo-ligase [Firmicutes bacterium]|nr:5-formyltetrahydrofolate cyclo-ligase [Bacillota bacterium]
MDKKDWRKLLLAQRQQQSPEEAALNSVLIGQSLLSTSLFRLPCRVMSYVPVRGEVDLGPLLTKLEEAGLHILLPKVMERGVIEAFHCPPPWQQFVAAASFGISEPVLGTKQFDPLDIDVVLVPGVAFDAGFYRLGYGGGYYDRFLPRLRQEALAVGVAFSLQVVDKLPRHAHDFRLDALVTERGMLWRPQGKHA